MNATFPFTKVTGLTEPAHRRWFRCRHCTDLFVGGPREEQPVGEERDACFAHEAVCPALFERIDPALAVDRALTAAERVAFFEHLLVGQFDGAQPADWISQAQDADAYLSQIEPWWAQYGDKHIAYLMTMFELPEQMTHKLLSAALYVTFGLSSATLAQPRRTHSEIASGAALWARGYAEALGWTPRAVQGEAPDGVVKLNVCASVDPDNEWGGSSSY